jgi:hypothetical protein
MIFSSPFRLFNTLSNKFIQLSSKPKEQQLPMAPLELLMSWET